MVVLLEARLRVRTFFPIFCSQEALLLWLVLVRECVSIHNLNVVHTVLPYLPEVADQQIPLLIWCLPRWCCAVGWIPRCVILSLSHCATGVLLLQRTYWWGGKYYDPGGGIQRAEGQGIHQIITSRNILVYQEVTLWMVIVVIWNQGR